MSPNKNFLILTCDYGFGHRSAANAIAKAMQLQHPQDSTTVIVNPISEEPASPLLKLTEQNYDQLVTTNPNFYRFTYEISNSRPASEIFGNTMTLALYRNVKQIIQKVHPNAILSTNEMFGGPTGAVIQTMKERLPFYTVVTDLADVHASWFNNHTDKFFVASDIVRAKAITCGIDPQKIFISGIPVNPGFAAPHADKPELRLKLNLDPQLPTLLFVGSRRVSGILDHLAALESLDMPFQVVVIAGGNQELFRQAIRRKWSFPIIQIHNYVTDMMDYMLCADLLVTKAGGLIISEGLAAGLPIFLIDYLPGQEEGNMRFLLDHQAGAVATSPEVLAGLVNTWFGQNPEISQTIAANARRCGHPDAALVIADALWQADEVQIPQTPQRVPFLGQLGHMAKQQKNIVR